MNEQNKVSINCLIKVVATVDENQTDYYYYFFLIKKSRGFAIASFSTQFSYCMRVLNKNQKVLNLLTRFFDCWKFLNKRTQVIKLKFVKGMIAYFFHIYFLNKYI